LLPTNKLKNTSSVGLSLREPNRDELFKQSIDIDFIEVLTENYSYNQSSDWESIVELSETYPILYHGLTMNIGGLDNFDEPHLKNINKLFKATNPFFITDHLCMSRHNGKSTFDLLPIPHTKNMIHHLKERYLRLQDVFGENIAFENISTYFRFKIDEMDEVDFYLELQDKTDIKFQLDINNLVVNQYNHGIDIEKLINNLIPDRIVAYHIAGYSDQGDFYFDAHDTSVPEIVWDYYKIALKRIGSRPTTIERDENIPSTFILMDEAFRAKHIMEEVASY